MSGDIDRGIECSCLSEPAVQFHYQLIFYRRIRDSASQAAHLALRSNQGLLVAELVHDQAVGGHLCRGIQPSQCTTRFQGCDFVVKLRRRRYIRIKLAEAADQYGIALYTLRA